MTDLRDFLMRPDPVSDLWKLVEKGTVEELEPALAALRMEIPKGYHHKDNLGHTVRALEKAMKRETNGPDLLLRTAVVLHDIGKPATRKFEGRGKVTFRNHETVGASQARRLLKEHGYSVAERDEVRRLVSLHMRAYGFGYTHWTDSAVRRLLTDAGSEVALDRLITIFYSDLTSTNVKHVRAVEDGIKKLEEALAAVRAKDDRAALRPALDGHELMGLTGLGSGRELGLMMRFLNSDEGVLLSREDALTELKARFPEVWK